MIRSMLLLCLVMAMSVPFSGNLNEGEGQILERQLDPNITIRAQIEKDVIVRDGKSYVCTSIRGEGIERAVGVPSISKIECLDGIAKRASVIKEVVILDPNAILPEGLDIAEWSYEAYGNPSLPYPIFVRSDPVNLVFDVPYSLLDHQLKDDGWESTQSYNLASANVNFILFNGRMIPQSRNYFYDDSVPGRYHLRVWRCDGIIIGQCHIDTEAPHTSYGYEKAEIMAIYPFSLHITRRNMIWLNNICTDPKGYRNNGWASYVTTYKYS